MRLVPARIGWTSQGFFQSVPFAPAQKRLGQETEHIWYARAKAVLAKLDESIKGTGNVLQAVGADFLARRDRVASYVAQAENREPVDFGVFANKTVQDDVSILELQAKEFGTPKPAPVEQQAEPATSDKLVTQLALGGILVAIAGILVFLDK